MPDPNPSHPRPLTPSARRARATAHIRTLTDVPTLVGAVTADALDLAAAGILAAVGVVDPVEARAVLVGLWADR